MVVDVFFGGRMIGDARVVSRPGFLKFTDPAKLLALVPNLQPSARLSEAFAQELPSNAGLVCREGQARGCGTLSPELVGIILDEDHFRVDLFINPANLKLVRPAEETYLRTPSAPLSLTSSSGLALSGSSGTSPVYNVQNRTIVGFHNARLRTDVSFASKLGLVADTIVGEVDRPGIRYSAGLFWEPGLDLTGERRIVGIGIASQFDTRSDRDTLEGTPLVLFLSQPARVDILIDGRLVTSAAYEAGNNLLDTSSLPDGSYSLQLQIHEANGTVREETRFFAKDPQIAPVGHSLYFAYAGKLANTQPGQAVSLSKDFFYQLGAARRLNREVAVDLAVTGTSNRPILEAGGWLITRLGRLRAAALASPSGDRGALLQLFSAQAAGFSLSLDVRRIHSHDGGPLIPLPTYVDTFEPVPINQRAIGNGSFTQASGSIGYQLGSAYLAVIGSLRKDRDLPTDYSIGPTLNWPFLNRSGLQLALEADAQLTRDTKAGYVGFRMLFNRRGYSVSNSAGARSLSSKDGSGQSSSRAVSDTSVQYSYSSDGGTDLSLAGGFAREIDSTAAHAQGIIYSPFGYARAELVQNIEGNHRTQYGLTLRTSALVDRNDMVLGGRDLAESAMVVSVDGSPGSSQFDVLVDGHPRARLKAGERRPILVEPYRAYSVTLRPVNAASVWYDSAERQFTLYPGNVQHVGWHVEHLLTIFGRALRPDGRPVSNALISSERGLGQSDADGYFQIETSSSDVLSFDTGDGLGCKVQLARLNQRRDYVPVGGVLCR